MTPHEWVLSVVTNAGAMRIADVYTESPFGYNGTRVAIGELLKIGDLQRFGNTLSATLQNPTEPHSNPPKPSKTPLSSAAHAMPLGLKDKSFNPGASGNSPMRHCKPTEVPQSGAKLVIDHGSGHWARMTPTSWLSPDGFTVSVRSMTPELRHRLNVTENEDGTPNELAIAAISAIRQALY